MYNYMLYYIILYNIYINIIIIYNYIKIQYISYRREN